MNDIPTFMNSLYLRMLPSRIWLVWLYPWWSVHFD